MSGRCESIGSFESFRLAEQAIKALRIDGLEAAQASIVEGEPPVGAHVAGYYNLPDRVLLWTKRGALWGGLWGLAFSIWLFWVPGVGPLLVTIPVFIGAVAVATIAALAAGVYSLGIPHNSIFKYAPGVQKGRFVVLFEGPAQQILRARHVLSSARSLAGVLNMPVTRGDTEYILPQ